MDTTFTVTRNGEEVELDLTWDVFGNIHQWEEHHPYGDTTVAEPMSEVDIIDVELKEEEWPKGMETEEMTPEEFTLAKKQAMEKAEDDPYEHLPG